MTAPELPRRIILSRKGVDASAGGFPSLICDGRLLNIPIPEDHFHHDVMYGQLPLPPGPWETFATFGGLVSHLTRGRINGATPVHLDPDVRPQLHPVGKRCRSALGQCCSFDAELESVGEGDLFLFFGWFAESTVADNAVRISPRHEHTLWGWLQTDRPIRGLAPRDQPSHPHEHAKRIEARHTGGRNSLYPALDHLTFLESIPGCGAFPLWTNRLRLTHPACRQGCRSLWRLPSFFHQRLGGIGQDAVWTRDADFTVVQAVGQHQEYVLEVPGDAATRQQIATWLQSLPWGRH
jgi:hypothetical protein